MLLLYSVVEQTWKSWSPQTLFYSNQKLKTHQNPFDFFEETSKLAFEVYLLIDIMTGQLYSHHNIVTS